MTSFQKYLSVCKLSLSDAKRGRNLDSGCVSWCALTTTKHCLENDDKPEPQSLFWGGMNDNWTQKNDKNQIFVLCWDIGPWKTETWEIFLSFTHILICILLLHIGKWAKCKLVSHFSVWYLVCIILRCQMGKINRQKFPTFKKLKKITEIIVTSPISSSLSSH